MITTESGITSRGNCILRTTFSLRTTEVTALPRRVGEEGEQHDVEEQHRRIVLDVVAEAEDLGEDDEQHAEEQQRAHERPQEAEGGAVVAELELGHRGEPEQVEEAPPPPPSADGPVISRSSGASAAPLRTACSLARSRPARVRLVLEARPGPRTAAPRRRRSPPRACGRRSSPRPRRSRPTAQLDVVVAGGERVRDLGLASGRARPARARFDDPRRARPDRGRRSGGRRR